jgi:hypothetical protein
MNREEEMALRELAAGRCAIQKVIDVLGPMSLWSKTELEKEILKAVAAEREACAKVCEERQEVFQKYYTKGLAAMCAEAIRARGEQ